MKMIYTIVAEMTAGGTGHGRFLRRHQDADGKVIVFETYKEAVQCCDTLNAAKVDRNLVYSVERKLHHYFGELLPSPQKDAPND
jgi:hypothetical protein